MNHKRVLFLITFIAVLTAAIEGQTSPEYKILFEKAKFTMESKGDLNGAITLFNDIIKKYPTTRTIDNHILKLRKKIEDDPSHPRYIISVYGGGYRFIG